MKFKSRVYYAVLACVLIGQASACSNLRFNIATWGDLTWSFSDDLKAINLTFTIQSMAPLSFLGMAFDGQGGAMPFADFTIIRREQDGSITAVDGYSEDFVEPKPDGFFGGTSDVQLVAYTVSEQDRAVVDVIRRFGSDSFDKLMTPKKYNVAFAKGVIDGSGLVQHQDNRLKAEIDFKTADFKVTQNIGVDVGKRDKQLLHGLLMAMAWGVNFLLSVWVARYHRHTTWWEGAHRVLGTLGTLTTWLLFFVARNMVNEHYKSAHAKLGLAMMVLSTSNSVFGTATSFLISRGVYARWRVRCGIVHKVLGWSTCAVAVAQIPLGMEEFGLRPNDIIFQTFLIWIGLLCVMFAVSEVRLQIGKRESARQMKALFKRRDEAISTVEPISIVKHFAVKNTVGWDIVNSFAKRQVDLKRRGLSNTRTIARREVKNHDQPHDCWVTVFDKVYDMSPFVSKHPGGPQYLCNNAGKDITKLFCETHPSSAYDVLDMHFIGQLEEIQLVVPNEDKLPLYTKTEVANHGKCDDAWVTIDGMVLNITRFIGEHPGGKNVFMDFLGGDLTAPFHGHHTDESVHAKAASLVVGKLTSDRVDTATLFAASKLKFRSMKAMELNHEATVRRTLKNGSISKSFVLPTISRDELKKHTTAASCWIQVNQRVYDVTKWLALHPGGANVLLDHAGQDCTEVFNDVHKPGGTAEILLGKFVHGAIDETQDVPINTSVKDLDGALNTDGALSTSTVSLSKDEVTNRRSDTLITMSDNLWQTSINLEPPQKDDDC